MLSLHLIDDAEEALRGVVRETPMEYSETLSQIANVPVFLKLECLQKTGSFKIRGAYFRLSRMTEGEKEKGLITCSAGNHGKGVAYAAKSLHVKATIYVPRDVDAAKYAGMIALGAEVVRSKYPGYDETEDWAKTMAAKEDRPFISAFDDDAVMAGNGGTLAREVLRQCPDAQTFLLPVGGGGMAAGFAFQIKETHKHARIIACQHRDSPSLKLSLEQGHTVTRMPAIETLAAGIEGGLGEKCFEVLKSRIDAVELLSEEEISSGVRWMLAEHHYLIEPSSAVALAAILSRRINKLQGPTVVVLSGRNISYSSLKKIVCHV